MAWVIVGITSLIGLTVPVGIATIGQVEERMQRRQEAIVKMMNYNPLTRTFNLKQFMEGYRAEQERYDTEKTAMVTEEDLKKFEKRKEYWPYK